MKKEKESFALALYKSKGISVDLSLLDIKTGSRGWRECLINIDGRNFEITAYETKESVIEFEIREDGDYVHSFVLVFLK